MKNNIIEKCEIKKQHISYLYHPYLYPKESKTLTLSTFISFIKKLRQKSLEDLVTELDTSFLSRIENGDTKRLTLNKAIAISNDLEVDFLLVLYLLGMELKSINLGMAFEITDQIYYGDYLLDSSKLDFFIRGNLAGLRRK